MTTKKPLWKTKRRADPWRQIGKPMPPHVPAKDRAGKDQVTSKKYYRPEVGSVWEDTREGRENVYVMVEGVSPHGPYGVQWHKDEKVSFHWNCHWAEFPAYTLVLNGPGPAGVVKSQYFDPRNKRHN